LTREVTPDDGDAIRVLFNCYRDRVAGDFAQFMKMALGWDLAYLKVNGLVVGAAIRRAGELHIGVLPEWRGRWATRSFIRRILKWAGESGPVTTGVMTGNHAGARLVEGTGFAPVEMTERGTRYVLSSQP